MEHEVVTIPTTESITISRQDYLALIRLAHLAFSRDGCVWSCLSTEWGDGHNAVCKEGLALRKKLVAHLGD